MLEVANYCVPARSSTICLNQAAPRAGSGPTAMINPRCGSPLTRRSRERDAIISTSCMTDNVLKVSTRATRRVTRRAWRHSARAWCSSSTLNGDIQPYPEWLVLTTAAALIAIQSCFSPSCTLTTAMHGTTDCDSFPHIQLHDISNEAGEPEDDEEVIMSKSHLYRSAAPLIPSSPPLHAHYFNAPSSPPSSSPLLDTSSPITHGRFFRRNTSNNDPFSGAAKGDMSQHPTFSSDARRLFQSSIATSNDVLGEAFDQGEADTSADADATIRANGHSNAASAVRDEMLGAMFESSDDPPTSDDHLEAVPWSSGSGSACGSGSGRSSMDMSDGNSMLTPEVQSTPKPYLEPGSPTANRRSSKKFPGQHASGDKLTPGRSVLAGKKRSAFSRSSSVNDPFGAFGSPRDFRPSHYQHGVVATGASPSPRAQRRRIGSSGGNKRTFTRADTSLTHVLGGFPDSSAGEDDGDADVDTGDELVSSPQPAPHCQAHIWHKAVETVWDKGETTLDLSNSRLTLVHPVVADLSKYVAIGPPRGGFAGTGTKTPPSSQQQAQLQLFLQNNRLTRLPSALFQLSSNLRVLSLRSNGLKTLPAAIGSMHNLRELNIANNELHWLPAEIQMLRLEQFRYFPNPFVQPSKGSKLAVRPVRGVPGKNKDGEEQPTTKVAACLAPLEGHAAQGVPSLREICIRRLLTSDEGDEGEEMLDSSTSSSSPPLMLLQQYDNGALRELDAEAQMERSTISLLESARRSIESKWGSSASSASFPASSSMAEQDSWCMGVHGRQGGGGGGEDDVDGWHTSQPADISSTLDHQGDDAGLNPHFNRCPCGGGGTGQSHTTPSSSDWPNVTSTRPSSVIYASPTETRLEWVSHIAGVAITDHTDVSTLDTKDAAGTGVLPVLWRGCSLGCLTFLS